MVGKTVGSVLSVIAIGGITVCGVASIVNVSSVVGPPEETVLPMIDEKNPLAQSNNCPFVETNGANRSDSIGPAQATETSLATVAMLALQLSEHPVAKSSREQLGISVLSATLHASVAITEDVNPSFCNDTPVTSGNEATT
jgi:hypothetical protein